MHLIVTVIIFVGLAAILIWVADWTSTRRRTALMFSIAVLPMARLTGPNMTRNAI
jgi:hypothetical protein